jgi:hypothetical protein
MAADSTGEKRELATGARETAGERVPQPSRPSGPPGPPDRASQGGIPAKASPSTRPSGGMPAAKRPSSTRMPAANPDSTEPMKTVDPHEILASMRGAYDPPQAAPAPEPAAEPESAPRLDEVTSAAARDLEARAVAEAKEAARDVFARKSVSPMVAAAEAHPLAAYELLARAHRLADLVSLTERVTGEAARARASSWSFRPRVVELAEAALLGRSDADTRFGNVRDVLATGGESASERALAAALYAHALAEAPRKEAPERAREILWLAAHSAFDATPLLDRALGEDADAVWRAIAGEIKNGGGSRAEAVVGCAALAGSGTHAARALSTELARGLQDPVLVRLLATSDAATPEEIRLEGEMLPAPRSRFATTLLALTGILLAVHVARLVAKLALAYRVPAEVSFTESGVRVKTRTEVLGRIVREREHVVLRSGLVRVVREVRFPRAAFYAGLLALALGSYVGVRAFADGVRSASPSLLLVGIVIVGLGIAADFVLGTLLPGSRGRCRIAFVPRSGPVLCIGDVDVRRADDALTRSLGRAGHA